MVLGYNERGELSQILNGFEEKPDQDCTSCGGAGWITCTWCHGTVRMDTPRQRGQLLRPVQLIPRDTPRRCPFC